MISPREQGVEGFFQPSAERLRGSIRARIAPIGAALLLLALAIKALVLAQLQPTRSDIVALSVGAFGAVLVVAAIWHGRYVRNAAISLAQGTLTYRGRMGLARTFRQARVGGIASRSVRFPYARFPTDMYVLYGPDRRALLTLPAIYWNAQDIESLNRKLGYGMLGKKMDVRSADLIREFPNALSFMQRNNVLIGMLIPVVVIAVGILLERR